LCCSAADIPATRFIGKSPDGMNATGESDIRNYHDRLASDQKVKCTPLLTRLDGFRLLERDYSPFGLTLSIEPHRGFADEASGVSINHTGWEALLLADRELVPNRLFGAVNLHFDTDRTRLLSGGGVEQEPTLGISTALADQVISGVWVGGEVRYLRGYQGAGLSTLTGQALYLGPTLYAGLGRNTWLSAAFSVEVWGRAVGTPGALDLVNFERYQAKFRVGYDF
jgi:Protein of unknown function (DUF1073)